ncbi:uncharacterized protein LOC132285443 [Cornus florida]|uniref:uncharacterized protein LOC132285443 n=1 Tax=Cornus florida TaxID=4283 RepID=UPI00289FC472|nr:uncharacterized protein LOC132285443 [Cornus florida]XP_059643621.1 uncharacterized protein LOC132285443 [Cornus florida]XP_059643622.1 uncharacterized protein LOC132285443 [Cornus florida]
MGYGATAAAYFGRLLLGLKLQREQSLSSLASLVRDRLGNTKLQKMKVEIVEGKEVLPGKAKVFCNPKDFDKMKKKLEEQLGVKLSDEAFVKEICGDDKRDGKSTRESVDDVAEKYVKMVKKMDALMSDDGEKGSSGRGGEH